MKASADEIRGEAINVLKTKAAMFSLHPDPDQLYAGKAKQIQMKHYMRLDTDEFHSFRDAQLGLE